jgi:excisionase family DNA binding protein
MSLHTPAEVARRLRVTPAAIRIGVNRGHIPAIRLGRHIRIHSETIDAIERGGLSDLTRKRERPQ